MGRCGLGWGNNHIQMRLHTPLLSTTILIPNIFLFHLYLYTAYCNILSIYIYYNAAESDAYEFREDFMNIVWDSNQAKKKKTKKIPGCLPAKILILPPKNVWLSAKAQYHDLL